MALTPRIAGTNLIPSGGGRFAATGAVANVDPNPLAEVNQTNALIYEGQSEFQYEQFDARQQAEQERPQDRQYRRRRNLDNLGRPFEQTQDRRVNTPMLENSSASFAAAFDTAGHTQAKLNAGPAPYQPITSLDNIITTYETTAQVIYDEIPPRGEKLSLTL